MSNRIEDELFDRVDSQVPELEGRFFPGSRERRSESDYPVTMYARVSISDADHTHDGPSDYTRSRYQLDTYAQTFEKAREVANKLRSALDGWDPDGQNIHEVIYDDDRNGFEEETMEDKISTDFFVAYKEPILQ